MYSAKEKLTHFHKLVSPTVVEADLALLHTKAPHLTDFTRFDLSPEKNHEDILFILLDHCEHDEIVRNRREFAANASNEDNDNDNANNSSEDGDENPETLNSNGDESPDADGGEGDENPSEEEGGDDSSEEESEDNESTESSTEENPLPSEDKDTDSSKEEKAKAAPKKKEEEYPKIDWDNLFDADVQMATVIYNDRINTWRKMKQLDELLETKPTAQAVAEMAELRIRNLQAFAELQSFNDTGKFLCKHPILFGRSEIAQLIKLLRTDPAEFLRQHKNVLDNIKRYKSFVKRKDRKEKREADKRNLEKYQEKERLFKMVLEQQNK